MLRSIKALKGYNVLTKKSERIGHVEDFYFDDLHWTVRYLIMDTGNWLPDRRILISPKHLGRPDWEQEEFPIDLGKDILERGPALEPGQIPSRKQEIELAKYFGWPSYWAGQQVEDPAILPNPPKNLNAVEGQMDEPERDEEKIQGIIHLRSIKEVLGCRIHALDGNIGHMDDFIVDDDLWVLYYIVVDTRNWIPGKKVLVTPMWVEAINWEALEVAIDLGKDTIKDSPEYDPSQPVNRVYEARLYDYYGRPKYWE
jgi:hypothetical protein